MNKTTQIILIIIVVLAVLFLVWRFLMPKNSGEVVTNLSNGVLTTTTPVTGTPINPRPGVTQVLPGEGKG